MIGFVLVAVAVATPDPGRSAPIGGVGLNALIIGLFFVVRPLGGRLRRLLPPWLPW
jgi:hypothetical protein